MNLTHGNEVSNDENVKTKISFALNKILELGYLVEKKDSINFSIDCGYDGSLEVVYAHEKDEKTLGKDYFNSENIVIEEKLIDNVIFTDISELNIGWDVLLDSSVFIEYMKGEVKQEEIKLYDIVKFKISDRTITKSNIVDIIDRIKSKLKFTSISSFIKLEKDGLSLFVVAI